MKPSLNLRIALSSLAAHKWRAILAMLGVFLGALAFTGVEHVSQMMVRQAEIETEKLGPNLYAVLAGSVRFRRSGTASIQNVARNFTVADADALIRGVPSVLEGAPFVSATMQVRSGSRAAPARLLATLPSYQSIRSFYPEYGRFFDAAEVRDHAKVCVLGRSIAARLFGEPADAVGQSVYLFRASFRVLGVMEAKGRDLSGEDQDEYLLMPLTTYLRRVGNQNWVNGVYLRLSSEASLEAVGASATAIMRERHSISPGQDDDFSTMSPKDTVQLQRQALDLMSTLGGISSVISFAVGGMGILSIMILVVRSRRVEIGIRRAVGGKRRDIIRQFLFESGLMAGLGGALGVTTTLALVAAGSAVADLPMVIDPANLAMTLVGSCLLGVAAGAYPAWQAARIEILDVLKS
ncbi:FtsX-like permease family protein [Pseudodesulfovibrio sp. F-1]|uniref:FtsX-like permease family protein n=1 Tax=Pseudodesulfovibrio alkaliphilus TaxID=2661613 RepID=A0A7K1KNQ3_9BACT|nr:ABC transporter permease [Pseudodesulfovibrio alkaliphilus]MUM77630.1 FtsX-like permease family protein [Pseudodesulfovibrio alkaliphilus]